MKRLVLGLLSLLLLSGCAADVPRPSGNMNFDAGLYDIQTTVNGSDYFQYRDGYLYFSLPVGNGNDYRRMNCSTGTVISLCPDPLCLHDTGACPLRNEYGMIYMVTTQGDILFHQWYSEVTVTLNGTEGEIINRLALYSPTSGKTRVLEDYGMAGAGFSDEIHTDEYRYYHGSYYDEASGEPVGALLRMSFADGSVVPFLDEAVSFNAQTFSYSTELLFARDGRIFLTDGGTVYSVNEDGGDRVDHVTAPITGDVQTDGTYLYYKKEGELCRIAIDGGTEERLGIFPYSGHPFRVTKAGITYLAGEPVHLGAANIPGYAASEVILEGGELRRCAHDGSDDKLIYNFDSAETTGIRPVHWIVIGDIFYATYTRWTDADGDGIYEYGDNGYSTDEILAIDTTDGTVQHRTITDS